MDFIKSLSIGKRIAIGNLGYCLPILILIAITYQAKTKDIDFAELEQLGNRYQKPLMAILEGVSAHRLVAQRALRNDRKSQGLLPLLQEKINRSFEDVVGVQAKIGEKLRFTVDELKKRDKEHLAPSRVLKSWEDLAVNFRTLSFEECDVRHVKLIADIRGMISYLGDSSNLILDPDLDSYYLMDVTLLTLPQLQDRVQEVIAFVEPILRRRTISEEQKIAVSVFSTLLQIDLDRIVTDVATSIKEDANFNGRLPLLEERLPSLVAQSKEKVLSLVSILAEVTKLKSGDDLVGEFLQRGEETLQVLYKFSADSEVVLSALLEARGNHIRKDRFVSLLISFVALLLAGFVSSGLSYSVKTSITDGLRGAMQKLRRTVDATRASGGNLVDTSRRLSASSTEQAAAIQETVATLNEISAMVNKSLDNSGKSADLAQRNHKIALHGKELVNQMEAEIRDINFSNEKIVKEIDESNRQIEAILQVIAEIGNKTKVINDIVFQTKLLSFNASVEAARAGEHGKGFAVVAEEVGNLARMSGTASKEISEMLVSSMTKVESIVKDTREGVQRLVNEGKAKVVAGGQTANKCGEALEKIVLSVGEMTQMVGEITLAAEEQAKGVSEITRAMNQLDQTTQENALMANQTAKYSERLSVDAEVMTQVVIEIEGQFLTPSSSPASSAVDAEASVAAVAASSSIELGSSLAEKRVAGGRAEVVQKAKATPLTTVLPAPDDPRFKDV